MYRLALAENRQPQLVAGSGQRFWFVDQARRLATIDTRSGLITEAAQLPLDGTFTHLLVGATHVYAIDQGKGRISVLAITSGSIDTISFPFVSTAQGFSIGTDDRIWMGGRSANVLVLDPTTKAVAAINFRTSEISALFVDSAARVWYADDASGGIGYYDQTKQSLVSVAIGNHDTVSALAMDRDGTLWVGTVAGQVLSVRAGVAGATVAAGGPIAELVRDAAGGVWSYVRAPGAVVYRALTAAGNAQVGSIGSSGLGLDAQGRIWLADQAGSGFYIALKAGE
jgi:ligand-binding sensor domain-containing protein